jgi:hypothetical protein
VLAKESVSVHLARQLVPIDFDHPSHVVYSFSDSEFGLAIGFTFFC